jgi:hypothetical protein
MNLYKVGLKHIAISNNISDMPTKLMQVIGIISCPTKSDCSGLIIKRLN